MSLPAQFVFYIEVQPRNGNGGIAVTGVEIGDKVSVIYDPATPPATTWAPGTIFEQVVSVANEIQQIDSTNHSGLSPLKVLLFRDSTLNA